MTQAELIKSRLEWIASIMEKQGMSGSARSCVVLFGWNQIRDRDRDYEIQLPAIPDKLDVGQVFWVVERSDSPDLVAVSIVEDNGETVFVKHSQQPVQFAVHREELKQTPIPLRPFAIRRSDLGKYLGDALAAKWHADRVRRIIQGYHGANS